MDYLKIYKDLMVDRLPKQPPPIRPAKGGVYYEEHHMQPRCKGGADTADNIIRLTPEDHFMAHMLLAKGYKNDPGHWAAVTLLAGKAGFNGHWLSIGRAFYGMARRQAAANLTGALSPRFDHTVYEMANLDGRVISGTRPELRKATGIPAGNLTMMILGNNKLTRDGWLMAENIDKLGVILMDDGFTRIGFPNANRQDQIFSIIHIDGRMLNGTMVDLAAVTGIKYGVLNCLRRDNKHVHGWRLASTVVNGIMGKSDGKLLKFDNAVYHFTHIDGRELIGTAWELRQREGLDSQIYRVIRGEMSYSYGWGLASSIDEAKKNAIKMGIHVQTFVHDVLPPFTGTRKEFRKHAQIGKGSTCLIFKGLSAKGWLLANDELQQVANDNSSANDSGHQLHAITSDDTAA